MEASAHRPRDASPSDVYRPPARDHLQDAIQTVESFVREINWPLRLQNAWGRVKDAALAPRPGTRQNESAEDIRTIKTQIEGLTKIVQGLADKPVTAKVLYTDILYSSASPKVSVDRIAPVLAYYTREVIIVLGDKELQ